MSQETSVTKNTRLKENQSEYIETNRKILTSLTSTIVKSIKMYEGKTYTNLKPNSNQKRVSSKRKIHVTESGVTTSCSRTGKQCYIIKIRPDFLV